MSDIDLGSADLAKFGFQDDQIRLTCRKCGYHITKTLGTTLLGTPVKYGLCKKTSHGISICKIER